MMDVVIRKLWKKLLLSFSTDHVFIDQMTKPQCHDKQGMERSKEFFFHFNGFFNVRMKVTCHAVALHVVHPIHSSVPYFILFSLIFFFFFSSVFWKTKMNSLRFWNWSFCRTVEPSNKEPASGLTKYYYSY